MAEFALLDDRISDDALCGFTRDARFSRQPGLELPLLLRCVQQAVHLVALFGLIVAGH
jgi:hypothetical protein